MMPSASKLVVEVPERASQEGRQGAGSGGRGIWEAEVERATLHGWVPQEQTLR